MNEGEARLSEERKQESLKYFQSKKMLEKAREVLKLFSGAKKAVSIYPPHHEICIQSVADFMKAFDDYLSWREDFSLRIIGDEFFFEEKLIPRESVLYYPLIKEFQSKEIGGISIEGGLSSGEFTDFLSLLNLKSEELKGRGGLRRLMQNKGISHISLDDPGAWEEESRGEKIHPLAREEYFDAVDVIRELADQVMSDRRLTVNKANRVVGVMLNRVGEDRSAVLGLATIKSYDEYTSFHSVNVLILSLALGSMLPLDRSALMILGTGALLHDLGKVTIPQSILTKTGPLTSLEWKMMQEHPVKGADILLAQPGVHPLSVMIAHEHHARYDLKGYPKVTGKDRVGLFSRIVEIADAYDAMTTARPYQDARTPDHAIRVLVKDMGTAFDPLLVKVFIDMMGFFPVGTPVRLATGEVGIVYEQSEGDALHPKVKIILDAEGGEVEPHIVNLIHLKEKVGGTGRAILESLDAKESGIGPLPYL
jgi:HD-GYP domain-containing protein (c-di-GMP phosphodiesterase class II)